MPTIRQMNAVWEAEFEFPEIRRDDDPMKPPIKSLVGPFTGKVIGTIAVDPETGDLKITPNQ